MVDLSTSGGHSGAEIPAHQIAAFHPRGAPGVFTGDRGQSVAGMTLAFERWIARQDGVAGIIVGGRLGRHGDGRAGDAGAAGGRAQADRLDRRLGEVSKYVGPADIMMMHSVADVQGLNAITEEVLGNAAQAMAGMVKARRAANPKPAAQARHRADHVRRHHALRAADHGAAGGRL
jgi:uncharacterized protein (UPF0261 family)